MSGKSQLKKVVLILALLACGYVIFAILTGAPWVFRLQMAMKKGVSYIDADGDGKPEYEEFFKKGKLVKSAWDTNNDGVMDVWNYFDDMERLILMEADFDFDKKIDYREVWENGKCKWIEKDFDAKGELIKIPCPEGLISDFSQPPEKPGENDVKKNGDNESKPATGESNTNK